LLDNPEKRSTLGRLAKSRANQEYSASVMVCRLEEIYRTVGAQVRAPAPKG